MLLQLLLFALGLASLVAGAWLLVTGGARIAELMGIAAVVIGLTIVAFGTSAPEFFVCLVAALRGSSPLMLGNIVGSNIANIGLILALAALIRPVAIERHLVKLELPLLLGSTLLFTLFCWDQLLDRPEGLSLLLLFALFMVLTLRSAKQGGSRKLAVAQVRPLALGQRRGMVVNLGLVGLGVGALTAGGQLIVESAVRIAIRLGASEALIGLTLVAIGTSLPELATTIVASVRRQGGIALGNVIGSNLFNVLAVGGPVSLLRPAAAESSLRTHQLTALIVMTALLPLMMIRKQSVTRRWGGGLLLLYGGIMAWWLRSGL